MTEAITIREATGADRPAVEQLAQLDEAPAPSGDTLLAFVDGRLAAARPLAGGRTVADPFMRTAALVQLLDAWALWAA
jgi:hypothetical protein